jgi:hypothetical protein
MNRRSAVSFNLPSPLAEEHLYAARSATLIDLGNPSCARRYLHSLQIARRFLNRQKLSSRNKVGRVAPRRTDPGTSRETIGWLAGVCALGGATLPFWEAQSCSRNSRCAPRFLVYLTGAPPLGTRSIFLAYNDFPLNNERSQFQ